MADLIAIGYPDETTAVEAADEARRLAKDLIIEADAIAVITRDKYGNYHTQTIHHMVVAGASLGMFWGLQSGISKEFQDQVRDLLQPGTSALFLMVEKVTPDKAVEAMSKYGGTVIKTSLSKEGEQELQEALHGGSAS